MPVIQETDAVYHARKEISNSMLGDLDPPYRYYSKYIATEKTPRESTPAMDEGAATHMLMLEPEQFTDRFAIKDKVDGRTKVGKEYNGAFAADNIGKTILTTDQFAKCEAMALAAFSHAGAAELLRRPGLHESTVLFDYPEGPAEGTPCRGRIDKIILADNPIILDIKTAQSASPKGFQRAVLNYNYHKQAMFYKDGLEECGDPRFAGASSWPHVWIVIESSAPHCIACYTMDDPQADRGRELHQLGMFTLGNCLKQNEWPHYTDGIEILPLLPWGYKDYDTTEVIA